MNILSHASLPCSDVSISLSDLPLEAQQRIIHFLTCDESYGLDSLYNLKCTSKHFCHIIKSTYSVQGFITLLQQCELILPFEHTQCNYLKFYHTKQFRHIKEKIKKKFMDPLFQLIEFSAKLYYIL